MHSRKLGVGIIKIPSLVVKCLQVVSPKAKRWSQMLHGSCGSLEENTEIEIFVLKIYIQTTTQGWRSAFIRSYRVKIIDLAIFIHIFKYQVARYRCCSVQ